ncbi:hypothetical protein ACWEKM_18845, partial [Streptomyces sp. NPDC004752]
GQVLHDMARDVERGNIGDQREASGVTDMILWWDLSYQGLYVCPELGPPGPIHPDMRRSACFAEIISLRKPQWSGFP